MSPKGFRITADLIVNEGPLDTAAGVFPAHESGPVLWSRQVLQSQRLTAVVLHSGPDDFLTTHAIAEKTAEKLGIGAIDVAVCVAADEPPKQSWQAHEQGWSVGCFARGPVTILTTDAEISGEHLGQALPHVNDTVLVLASGASGIAPALADFTAFLSQVHFEEIGA